MTQRRVFAVTGSRADYGLMRAVFVRIANSSDLSLHLMVTGMHLLPDFRESLAEIRRDSFGQLHTMGMLLGEDGGRAMAQSFALGTYGAASCLEAVSPDIVLLQGDRGEMLATAIAAAHMNLPIIHMSGGDLTGTIDQPIRDAISQFAHIHLTTCESSSTRLLAMGEAASRVLQVGEPGLDAVRTTVFVSSETLAAELGLDLSSPVLVATMHPETTEFRGAAVHMRNLLEALDTLAIQTVFTYPNSDAGGKEMTASLESYRDRHWIRIVPTLGSRGYLSLLRIATALVGNSSSGLIEAPSFNLPAVNVGARQFRRLRACNVIDVGYASEDIRQGIEKALSQEFRQRLANCTNPYGDGHTAERTVRVLQSLHLSPLLVSKWLPFDGRFVAEGWDEL